MRIRSLAAFARTGALLLLLAAAPLRAQRVDRVEPPGWWTGMVHDTVELLVSGRDLAGLQARFEPPGPVVLGAASGGSPHHLFVTVHVPEDCPSGEYRLRLTGMRGGTTAPWRVDERAPREGRHRGFGPDDVLYLITPDRFADGDPGNNYRDTLPGLELEFGRARPGGWHGGDLAGIERRLDYLADLGVTALWLNPFLENAGRGSYHGYAATDLYREDPRFGAPGSYARLADAARARGLKLVFDHVFNHVGVRHPWVAAPPTPTWFHGTVAEHERDPHQLPALLDPHAAPGAWRRLHEGWFADAMPDLNQRDPRVARYLIQQALWWTEHAGLDGIREDTWPYADPRFAARWVRALQREYPSLTVVGECWGTTAFTALFQEGSPLAKGLRDGGAAGYAAGRPAPAPGTGAGPGRRGNGGAGASPAGAKGPPAGGTVAFREARPARLDVLPSVMDFGLQAAFDRFLRGQAGLYPVYERLAEDALFADPAMLVTFLGNHDMARPIDRAGGDADRYRLALFVLLTTRGIPQLLYGEEIGLRAAGDPDRHEDLRRDFPGGFPHGVDAAGRAVPGDPPADARSAFSAEGRTPDEAAMHAFTRTLLHLRGDHAVLRRGALTQLTPRWDGAWAWLRHDDSARVLCAVHTGGGVLEHAYLEALLGPDPVTLRDLRTGEERFFGPGEKLALPPMGTGLWAVRP